ncbi:hypothetical protein LTR53_003866 [Teratosphaeriaceae sp. CCFEE 6253]|nr:hypothetical protein LTR53_003866 [Teratosphaeriaceae sp. CCFEE 6253]
MGSEGIASPAIHKVLVLGNNRTTTSIFNALAKDSVDVHLAVPRLSDALAGLNVQLHQCDLSRLSLGKLLGTLRPDLIVSTSGGGSFDVQRDIIEAALGTGVRRFVPAEFGHDSHNQALQHRLPPLAERARVIDYLRDLADQGRIEWVGIATGTPLDHGLQSGNLGFDLKWQSATLHGKGTERFAASSTGWIGRVVSQVVKQWDGVRNQYMYAAGLVTTANDVLECLERRTGQQWTADRGDVEDCIREAEQRVERGFPDAGMFLMERSVLYDEGLDAVGPFIGRDAKPVLGLGEEDVDDVVKSAVHAHKHLGKADCGC